MSLKIEMNYSRFAFLSVVLLLYQSSMSFAALRSYNFTIHSETRAPDGVSREVYLINGQQPGPLIDVDEGDSLEIFVQNNLPVDTTIHWHGILQRASPQMDGVPGVTQYPIPAGGNFTYRFNLRDEYGFFWYHSHLRAYYNDAIRGPLLVRPLPSRRRPFEQLASTEGERKLLMNAERDAPSILLNDWTHDPSDVIWSRYFTTGAFPNCVDSILANGNGRVQCLPEFQNGMMPKADPTSLSTSSTAMMMSGMNKRMKMDGSSMDMGTTTMAMEGPTRTTVPDTATTASTTMMMASLGPRGCAMPMMFNPGYNASSLPPETCTNTTSNLLNISANGTTGWLALNLVNSGAVSALRVSLDGHSMFVYAADGSFVQLQEVKVLHMALGQRYSVMIRLNQMPGNYYLRFATYPVGDMQQVMEGQAIISYNTTSNISTDAMDDPSIVWMLKNGSAKSEASLLNPWKLAPFESNSPPSKAADRTQLFAINQTGVTAWVMNKAPFTEPRVPILYGAQSEGWLANTTIRMPSNSVIDIVMNVANESLDTMGHPMHLHGHKFWVLGTGTGTFPYATAQEAPKSLINLQNPPYRDTVELPSSGWAVIRYITDNPGAWLMHCHLQWHIVSGMAVVLIEGEDKLPGLLGSKAPPTISTAVSFRSGYQHIAWATVAIFLLF
ncbi:Cupredoxin, partial [Metarhizium hybridum]